MKIESSKSGVFDGEMSPNFRELKFGEIQHIPYVFGKSDYFVNQRRLLVNQVNVLRFLAVNGL